MTENGGSERTKARSQRTTGKIEGSQERRRKENERCQRMKCEYTLKMKDEEERERYSESGKAWPAYTYPLVMWIRLSEPVRPTR